MSVGASASRRLVGNGLRRRRHWRKHVAGYLFMMPWLLGFFIFTAGPMIATAVISFVNWDLLRPPQFAGLANFERMVSDDLVGISLGNTAYYTFLSVPLYLLVALLMAALLSKNVRGISLLRTIYYLPTVTPAVASAILWVFIFNLDYGLLNNLLRLFGFPPVGWLSWPETAKPALILMGFWRLGNQMVIFLAGLQAVPVSLYEAAMIDGAGALARFRHVTLPMISPVIFFNLVLGVIGSFQVFTTSFIMTAGGPVNATLFLVLHIYRNAFRYYRMGYGCALAWLLFAIVLIFTLIQFKMGGRWVYYEARQ